ncbi:MAG: hypothetical protein Q8933_15155 [Bacteroidota bacterium]|nr:hypothetical protein [Bacteroidota bacterium]
MNDFEKQKLGMYESVLTLLSENRDIVSSIRSFTSNSTKLRKVMDEIRRLDKELSSEILDKTIQNAKAKDDLINAVYPVISGLFNFAKMTNDLSLKEKTRITKSHLYRMLDKELMDKAEAARMFALTYVVQLKKFGITTNLIHELTNQTSVFKSTLENKVSSLISSSTVMLLSDLFKKADGILGIMDQFVETLEDEYEEFYVDYLDARDLENQDVKKILMEEDEDEVIEE